jgi:hypothetical protein
MQGLQRTGASAHYTHLIVLPRFLCLKVAVSVCAALRPALCPRSALETYAPLHATGRENSALLLPPSETLSGSNIVLTLPTRQTLAQAARPTACSQ